MTKINKSVKTVLRLECKNAQTNQQTNILIFFLFSTSDSDQLQFYNMLRYQVNIKINLFKYFSITNIYEHC